MCQVFYSEADATELKVAYPYFHSETPDAFEVQGSYAVGDELRGVDYEWSHSLGDVVNALLDAGLRLEVLHEFPFASYRALPFMVEGADRRWRLPEHQESVPLIFSIKAFKPK